MGALSFIWKKIILKLEDNSITAFNTYNIEVRTVFLF